MKTVKLSEALKALRAADCIILEGCYLAQDVAVATRACSKGNAFRAGYFDPADDSYVEFDCRAELNPIVHREENTFFFRDANSGDVVEMSIFRAVSENE